DELAARLTQLAQQAAAAPARADDERAPAFAARPQLAERVEERTLAEPGDADRDRLADDDRGGDGARLPRPREPPHAAVQAEEDERRVAGGEDDGQRDEEQVAL